MPRSCSICAHAKANDINTELLRNESMRVIAKRYSVTNSSLQRHSQAGHVPKALRQARRATEIVLADSLLDRLVEIHKETMAILQEARDTGNAELALRAIARAEKQIELEARLVGELKEQSHGGGKVGRDINIQINYVQQPLPSGGRVAPAIDISPSVRQEQPLQVVLLPNEFHGDL